ncbi:relaxase MobL [Weissella confusa]|uniref:MobP2 family relaxase n=1 Tax=Weissella confusa TaxID=1583 RepID=UPI001C6F6517|nr:MobP2 family relaxase [Weissella confusa]QYU57962.1 relaxase MobL [Weissella confusa]
MKTGGKANFAVNEHGNGMVIMPMQFVTAKTANARGQKFADLVDYSLRDEAILNENNVPVDKTNSEALTTDILNQLSQEGYATRADAVTETYPIFNSEKFNLNDHDISELKKDLQTAQDNGNTLHEHAFSIRADWLIENDLYNPVTKELDQNALKQAEQNIVNRLFENGQDLPLGESPGDVVWFGVIHQDTDHLNMHLWYVKKSKETRPEMLHSKTGEPKGVVKLSEKNRGLADFRRHLMSKGVQKKRNQVYERVDNLRANMRENSLEVLDSTNKYYEDLRKIYVLLPQDLRGRWKVGNTDQLVTDPQKSRMAVANIQMEKLINKLLTDDLKDDYAAFQRENNRLNQMTTRDNGQIHSQSIIAISERNDRRLRKEMANRIYRQFNENFKSSNSDSSNNTDLDKNRRSNYVREADGSFERIKFAALSSGQEPQKPVVTVVAANSLNRIANGLRRGARRDLETMHRFIRQQTQLENMTMTEAAEHATKEQLRSDKGFRR